jgi:hypothetical protein
MSISLLNSTILGLIDITKSFLSFSLLSAVSFFALASWFIFDARALPK